jgi:thiamine kinase-like enzyme
LVSTQYNPEIFCLIPSASNPRWLIPLKNHQLFIASLALYQPSLLRAKVIKRLTILFARLGIAGMLVKNRLYFERNDEFIRKIFNRNDLYYAVFTGTESSHRKVTVQVMDEKGRILGYIKVADSDKIDALLKNEAELLRDLSKLKVEKGLFPEVLYYGSAGDVNILVLDSVKSSKSTYSSRLSEKHIEFLAELFNKTSYKEMLFSESSFFNWLQDRVRRLEDEKLRGSEKGTYQRALDSLERKLGIEKVPLGLCHRDFTPWNTFFHNRKLYVFDWEYSEREYPPLMDVFHFIVQDGIQVRHLKPEKLIKRVLGHGKWLSVYCGLVGVKESLIVPLFVCYLLDISLLYIERERGNLSPNILKVVETWREMIEIIIARYIAHGS